MDFVNLLQNFGLAVAILVVLGIALWRAAVWFGQNVLKPVTDRHIKFLDELSAAIASQSQALQTMTVQQGRNLSDMQAIMEQLKEIVEKQDHVIKTLAETETHRAAMRQPSNNPPFGTGIITKEGRP